MFYELLQDYTHHGGTIKNLTTIPKGTLISREPFREIKNLEYSSCSYGEKPSMFLSAEVVENNPTFFKKLTEEEYTKALTKLKLKNTIYEFSEILEIKDFYDILDEVFVEKPQMLEEKELFEEQFRKFQEAIEEHISQTPLHFPNLIPNDTYPIMEKCHCGNDGTKPCWSTACPQRIIISYGGNGTGPSTIHPTWTVTATIHNINNKENNDQ
jgi:hypothetical protein